MNRRMPTRLELKLDDIQEFEKMKRDLEARRARERRANTCNTAGAAASASAAQGEGEDGEDATAANRISNVHQRIGYEPNSRKKD